VGLVAAHLQARRGGPLLLVAPEAETADDLEEDLATWGVGAVLHFPPWDVLPCEAEHLDLGVLRERVRVLRALAGGGPRPSVVLTSVTALMQPTLEPAALAQGELALAPGDEMAPETLAARLQEAGLEPVTTVEAPGQFARRGGILDAYPLFAEEPVRIDFFGDSVDTIQRFDPVSQISTEDLDRCTLVDIAAETVHRVYDRGPEKATLATHLPPETLVVAVDPQGGARRGALYEEGFARHPRPILGWPQAAGRLAGLARVLVPTLAEEGWYEAWGPAAAPARVSFGVESLARLEGTTEHALEALGAWLEAGTRVTIFCHNEASRSRCREFLLEEGGGLAARVELALGRISRGFRWPALGWAAVGDHELFHRYKQHRRVRKRPAAGAPIRNLSELRRGDYVVHVLHGIARFEGVQRLEQNDQENDYLKLRFAEEAQLYVPLSHIDLVQKYVGGRESRPELSRLGGKTWSRRKQQAEKAVREVAADLLRLQAARQASRGIAYPSDTEWMRRFEAEFIYDETEDQLAAIQAIKADMEARVPMDRLLCGDVGFGKTEVAARAAFKAVTAGKQVAVLVPTTILAEQHLHTFRERTADYPIRVEGLSRFRSAGAQRRIVEETREGKVDVLIGTHRLLSADVGFADLGLVIIDEEQRFGVEHKERLKELRVSVDVLTMTATPIPRTLHMGLLGLRDISTLATPPQDRQAIQTQVVRFRDELVRRAVLRELARGGQIYFVHNRVHSIEAVALRLAELVPEARIGIGHGQMHEHDLEEVMQRFVNHEIDLLVATTIIESGLDIPNVNTIFVDEADHYGLAELHQLRGRVGRYRHRAYAYFLVPKQRPPSPVGQKRLKAIEEFAELGAGFELALRDLEIRGAGNLLGVEQSGHINQVGYELYCRLLERVVQELRGEEPAESEPVELELGADAYVPETYMPAEAERVRFYRQLAECRTAEDLELLQSSLADRYGAPPEAVLTLFDETALRLRAQAAGINYIGRLERAVILGFTERAQTDAVRRLRRYDHAGRKLSPLEGGRYRFGLGRDERAWPGFHRHLADEALRCLEGRAPAAAAGDDGPARPQRTPNRLDWLHE
jgi:transcription-repair coupling factor (superfamily II helicase)